MNDKGYRGYTKPDYDDRIGNPKREAWLSRSNLASYAYECLCRELWGWMISGIPPNDSGWLECLLEEVGGSFYRRNQASCGPMNPWQRIISSLHLNRPWSRAKMNSQRLWGTVLWSGGRQVAPMGRPTPPSVRLGPSTLVCLWRWIRGPLSWFRRGWSLFALMDRSILSVFWLNLPIDTDSPTLVEFVSLNP